jgi:hypothetical protein
MHFKNLTRILTTVALFFLIAGCQTMTLSSGTGSVSPENRVPFPEGQNAGVWKGNYLVVDYKYSRALTDIDMTGMVNFADNMTMNFVLLRDFHLSAIFLDENGKVLGTKGLTTGRGSFDPISFRAQMAVPPATVAISFSYQGTAIEGGNDDGGGINHFWQYPIH